MRIIKSIFLTIFVLLSTAQVFSFQQEAKADINDCKTFPMIHWRTAPLNDIVPTDTKLSYYVTNSNPAADYSFAIKVLDKASGKIFDIATKTLTAAQAASPDTIINLNTAGDKELYALYNSSGNAVCSNGSTNSLKIIVRSNTASPDDITLNVPSSIKQGESGNISFNMKNQAGWYARLLINTGAEGCSDNDGDTACWSEKWTLTLPNNDYSNSQSWDASSSTNLGPHTIMLKVENGNTVTQKTASITVCDSSGKNCTSSSGSGSTGGGSTSTTGGVFNFSNLNKTLKWFLTGEDSSKNMANANLGDIEGIITRTTNYALDLAGVIALIIILYSAFMYATSFGEESKAEAAKKALTWSIIGMIAIIFSKAIMLFVNNALK